VASSRRRRQRSTKPKQRTASRGALPRAKKSLGQHFLIDNAAVDQIALLATPQGGETVVEIGAGLGHLTAALSERAARVVAIEKDDTLAVQLKERFADTNVHVVHADALEMGPARALSLGEVQGPYIMAGNLPYNIAQPLLRHYLEGAPAPTRIVAMVQLEVAQSIVAKPGSMSLLSVSVQLHGTAELILRLPPSAFQPPPKVHSAVVRIDVEPRLRAPVEQVADFFFVARAGFAKRRKQLRNALANSLQIDTAVSEAILANAGIGHTMRAQELSLGQWAELTRSWTDLGRPGA
jgi:16S rRNA (adenine1518-N6/adenine1519-N6)-dimethyltransferase